MKGRTKMGGLNLYTDEDSGVASEKKKRSRSPKIILGLCVLLAIPVIGTTFASTVTVNSGKSVDFGQGQAGAIACDPQVTVSPGAAFVSTGGGTWQLDTITIGGINTTNSGTGATDQSTGCAGDSITLTGYDTNTATVPNTTVTFTVPASLGTKPAAVTTGTAGTTATLTTGNSVNDTITVVLGTPVSLSTYNVNGFTIQQN